MQVDAIMKLKNVKIGKDKKTAELSSVFRTVPKMYVPQWHFLLNLISNRDIIKKLSF